MVSLTAAFKRKGTLVSAQAAAGAKLLGKPRDTDEDGRELVTSEEMQDLLWKRIWSLKKECGRLNDEAVHKEAEVIKLGQRLVTEIEFEKQQADGMPDDFASAIAGAASTGVGGKEAAAAAAAAMGGRVPFVNNAAAIALKSSDFALSARGKASAAAAADAATANDRRGSAPGSARPRSPPEWEMEPHGWTNAAALHYLRDAPLIEHLARQTEDLAVALEVEQAGAMTLAHVCQRLKQDKQKMQLAVEARRSMLERCVEEIDLIDRERKHAQFMSESARDKKAEKVKHAAAAADDRARQLEDKQGLRDAVAQELQEAREQKERENKELAAKIEVKESERTAFRVSVAFGGNLANVKKAKEEEDMSTVMKLTAGRGERG